MTLWCLQAPCKVQKYYVTMFLVLILSSVSLEHAATTGADTLSQTEVTSDLWGAGFIYTCFFLFFQSSTWDQRALSLNVVSNFMRKLKVSCGDKQHESPDLRREVQHWPLTCSPHCYCTKHFHALWMCWTLKQREKQLVHGNFTCDSAVSQSVDLWKKHKNLTTHRLKDIFTHSLFEWRQTSACSLRDCLRLMSPLLYFILWDPEPGEQSIR